MTPGLFEGTDAKDEYTFMHTADATQKIDVHRKTFITEKDWQWLKANSITHVRLPVGYWVLEDDGPYVNARSYLDWAFAMGEKYDIHILLDLHGLKGSQNGMMHSGKIGRIEWKRYEADNLKVVRELARRYGHHTALWGFEIINEPMILGNYFALLRYYRNAYRILRQELRPGVYTVFQDGFVPPLFSGALWERKHYPVVMDTHLYLLFGSWLRNMQPERYDRLRGFVYGAVIRLMQLTQPVIVGEWGSVLPQAMFDKVPQKDHLPMLGETIRRQRHLYRHALATFYWNYKTEGRGMYNYRSLVEDNVI